MDDLWEPGVDSFGMDFSPVPSGSRRWASGLTLAALAWAVGLIVAAVLLPAYGGSESAATASVSSGAGAAPLVHSTAAGSITLVDENGPWVLVLVTLPALVCGMVWTGLRGGRRGVQVARVAIGLLGAFCLVAAMSIGLFVLPVAVLLGAAAARAGLRA
jgi:hypothetical protein